MKKEHIDSNFDDFLREENFLKVAEATASDRVTAFLIAQQVNHHKGHQVSEGESDEDSLVEPTLS